MLRIDRSNRQHRVKRSFHALKPPETFVEGAVVQEAIAAPAVRAIQPQPAKLFVEDRAAHFALVRNRASRNKGRCLQ
jgi:hypothetical protein